jgi:serine/threonine-protein kinase
MPHLSTASSKRACPLCGTIGDASLCAHDGMATLLVDAPASDARSTHLGQLIATRYRLRNILGRGTCGTVFEAENVGTGQPVALKILSVGEQDAQIALRRFFLEARVTSGLQHPNTVRVYDFGQEDSGLVYLVMEFLRGKTLKTELTDRSREGRTFAEREAVEIALAITRSLGEAHAANLVHRDLKPENILLQSIPGDDPIPRVLDFGIAKVFGAHLTATGQPMGSPAYMSPEQAGNRPVDARSDLYSLGVMLFHMVSGRLPFIARTPHEMMRAHLDAPLPDLRALASGVSLPFVQVVERAMARDVDERFPDAVEMRSALRLVLERRQG